MEHDGEHTRVGSPGWEEQRTDMEGEKKKNKRKLLDKNRISEERHFKGRMQQCQTRKTVSA